MAGNLLQIGTSGLQAYQRALNTTGHNIANVNTPGYSRQETVFTTAQEQRIANYYQGSGVFVEDIRRFASQFVINQLRQDTSTHSQLSSFDLNIRQLDSLLADETTGLNVGLDKFFNALQAASENPTSIPARQLVLTEASGLASRFTTVQSTMESQNRAINQEIEALVEQVNSLAAGVAELNRQIVTQQGSGGDPNDLLDKRDELIRQLSEIVSVQVIEQDDNTLNVFIGKGQSLVVGVSANNLSTLPAKTESAGVNIVLQGTEQVLDNQITGGMLGGLLDYRDNILQPAFNNLGLVALAVGKTVNDQQRMGLDLSSSFGGRIFNDVNDRQATLDRVTASPNNTPPVDRVISISIDDVQSLKATNYTVEFIDNSTFTIRRDSDNSIALQASLSGLFPETVEVDGMRIAFEAGSFQRGDEFFLEPTRNAASEFEVEMNDPRELAFAAAIRTQTSTTNQGTGSISQGDVFQVYDAETGNFLPAFATSGQLTPPLIIRFTTPTTYDVLDNSDPSNPKQLDPPIRNQVFIPGSPKDVFTLDQGQTIATSQARGTGDVGLVSAPVTVALPAVPNPVNGYSAQTITVSNRDPDTGIVTTSTVNTLANATAQEIANQLSQVDGVSANAFNQVEITNIIGGSGTAIELSINGESLTNSALGTVPVPDVDPLKNEDYIQVLADRINNNGNLTNQGIYAVVSETPGAPPVPTLKIYATTGVDLDVQMTADAADSFVVSNGQTGAALSTQTLTGSGPANATAVTIGGSLDVTMTEGVSFRTTPFVSSIFGDTSSFSFAKSSFKGFQVTLQGRPEANDTFTIDFNENGTSDNRNGFKMANLATQKTILGGTASYSEGYGQLVEFIGVNASQARIDLDASEALLNQTVSLRNSDSGVNMDEEAANLIRFQQAYNASAQVINVAREIFDTLLNAF